MPKPTRWRSIATHPDLDAAVADKARWVAQDAIRIQRLKDHATLDERAIPEQRPTRYRISSAALVLDGQRFTVPPFTVQTADPEPEER